LFLRNGEERIALYAIFKVLGTSDACLWCGEASTTLVVDVDDGGLTPKGLLPGRAPSPRECFARDDVAKGASSHIIIERMC